MKKFEMSTVHLNLILFGLEQDPRQNTTYKHTWHNSKITVCSDSGYISRWFSDDPGCTCCKQDALRCDSRTSPIGDLFVFRLLHSAVSRCSGLQEMAQNLLTRSFVENDLLAGFREMGSLGWGFIYSRRSCILETSREEATSVWCFSTEQSPFSRV